LVDVTRVYSNRHFAIIYDRFSTVFVTVCPHFNRFRHCLSPFQPFSTLFVPMSTVFVTVCPHFNGHLIGTDSALAPGANEPAAEAPARMLTARRGLPLGAFFGSDESASESEADEPGMLGDVAVDAAAGDAIDGGEMASGRDEGSPPTASGDAVANVGDSGSVADGNDGGGSQAPLVSTLCPKMVLALAAYVADPEAVVASHAEWNGTATCTDKGIFRAAAPVLLQLQSQCDCPLQVCAVADEDQSFFCWILSKKNNLLDPIPKQICWILSNFFFDGSYPIFFLLDRVQS
jgi:hypothetical protein